MQQEGNDRNFTSAAYRLDWAIYKFFSLESATFLLLPYFCNSSNIGNLLKLKVGKNGLVSLQVSACPYYPPFKRN